MENNKFEVWVRYNDEESSTEQFWFDNYILAQHKYLECLYNDDICAVVVISHITGYDKAVVLAYSNDWDDNFIKIPEWAC